MKSMNEFSDMPRISIGLPVYNGEKFLRKKIESILSQTFENFEFIISDNGSTDTTENICLEYQKKDSRIKYFRHETNKGITWNFNYVLEKSECEFIVFTAIDDIISKDFLEKNLKVLQDNPKVVMSISKIGTYSHELDDINKNDKTFQDLTKILREKTRPRDTIPISGSYEKKVRMYLKQSTCQVIYGLFRKSSIKKTKFELFIGNDWAVILDVLKNGDCHVIDEVLMYEYERGTTGKGIIDSIGNYNPKIHEKIFPWYPITKWCWKHLGTKVFLKNIDYFIQLNIEGGFSLIIDLIRRMSNGFLGK